MRAPRGARAEATTLGSSHVLVFAMGLTASIGLGNLGLGRRGGSAHRWLLVWCALALVYQAARHAQLHTADPGEAAAAARLYVAMAPLLIWSLVCFARSLQPEPAGALPAALLLPCAAWAAAIGFTPVFFTGEVVTRTDWFGRPYLAVPTTPASLALLVAIAGALAWVGRQLWSRALVDRRERRVLLASLAVYAGLGAVSVLSALRWISTPALAEFGPGIVAVGLNHILAHRHRRLQHRLEEAVAERTEEIEAAHARLVESQSRYRELVENAPVGVFAADHSGELVAVNARLLEMIGSPNRPDTRRAVNVFTNASLVETGVSDALRACLETGVSSASEWVYTSRWGRTLDARLTAAPLRDARGRTTGVLGIVEDITGRKALERRLRQSQKLEAVGQLAAGIAHEINNPMAYVRTNLALLRDEWGTLRALLEKDEGAPVALERLAGWEELIDESLEGVERAVAIVRDVREFSHLGGEERVATDLNPLVESSVRVAATWRRGATRIEESYEPMPPFAAAPGPLRQVFVNLVVNALQAVGESGRVRVSTRAEGDEAVVRVEDDGPGVASEIQHRLFDPFFTTKPAGEGTGLGLYVSWEIVRLHGGEIRLHATPGGGATFDVRLPRLPAAPQ